MNRAQNIKAHLGIVEVLADLGYRVYAHGGEREQQFSCDLHGDGSDSKPSARAYPDSNSWYCFACGKVRDAVSTVREKFGYDYTQACQYLEHKYGITYTPSQYGNDSDLTENRAEVEWDLERARIEALLKSFSQDFQDRAWLLSLWEGFDYLVWKKEKSGEVPLKALGALKDKAMATAQQKIKRGDI